MTDPRATLLVVTRDDLRIGEEQSLALRITTLGFRSVFVVVPLGTGATALMSREAFRSCHPKYGGRRPQGVGDIGEFPDDAAFRVPILSGTGRELTFEVALERFLVAPEAGTATLELRGDALEGPIVATAEVTKRSTPPGITSFFASAYNVIAGDPVTLEWTLNEAADFELVETGGAERVLVSGRGAADEAEVDPSDRKSDYALRVLQGGTPVDERRLRIHAFDATGFHVAQVNAATAAPIAGVLGLHAFGGRLYALLRIGSGDRVELWYTTHGFDPRAWAPEKNGQGEIVALGLEAARRPGVVFDGKLWLIGGDCCDPDSPGSEISVYDFQATAWTEINGSDRRRWPAGMAARMGHAVVRAPTRDAIWVMGGWSQDGGLCKDVWEFDGNDWTRLDHLACEACLFGATRTEGTGRAEDELGGEPAVWRFGGFLEPGGRSVPTILQAYGRNGTKISNARIKTDTSYCASALFAPDRGQGLPYGVCTLYNFELKGFGHEMIDVLYSLRIAWNPIGNPSASGVLQERDYSHLQAAEFNGATFFRALVPDRNWPPPGDRTARQIGYLVRVGGREDRR